MKKKQTVAAADGGTPAVPAAPVAVTDLGVLESFCAAALEVTVVVRGRPFHFTGRRLNPAESRQIKMILESAVPAVIKGDDQVDRYDFKDAGYLKAKESAWCRARALAIWFGFPCFKAKAEQERPALAMPATSEEIVKWMQDRQLEDDVLEGLFDALTREEVNSYLGFTSGDSSRTL